MVLEKKQNVVRDYSKIHGEIHSIGVTSDEKHLWTSGCEDNGHVKQFCVTDGHMIQDYGVLFEG